MVSRINVKNPRVESPGYNRIIPGVEYSFTNNVGMAIDRYLRYGMVHRKGPWRRWRRRQRYRRPAILPLLYCVWGMIVWGSDNIWWAHPVTSGCLEQRGPEEGRRRRGGAASQARGLHAHARRLHRASGLGRGPMARQPGQQLAAVQEGAGPRGAQPIDDGGVGGRANGVNNQPTNRPTNQPTNQSICTFVTSVIFVILYFDVFIIGTPQDRRESRHS